MVQYKVRKLRKKIAEELFFFASHAKTIKLYGQLMVEFKDLAGHVAPFEILDFYFKLWNDEKMYFERSFAIIQSEFIVVEDFTLRHQVSYFLRYKLIY